MKFINNPPDAASLMMSARSFGNYDLAAALADLIDNSIKAEASEVAVQCLFNGGNPEVRVTDNGCGMSAEELQNAMRPASTNPADERSPDDLGRFGWGLKSASFSQCKRLTVVSRQDGELSGAVWDLEDLDEWKMGILSAEDFDAIDHGLDEATSGTSVIWEKCDRLSENGSISPEDFNDAIDQTADQLALVFHRFLEGLAKRRPRLSLSINGTVLAAYDPFYRGHEATQHLEAEPLRIDGSTVTIQPYVLPHFSKLRPQEHEKLGGQDGFLRNQGFYVYRNDRLIIHGTWFRLAKFGELSQLVRISVDIPNSMDDMWKITVDKSDAQLPALLRTRLRQIVNGIKKKSGRTYRQRGGRIDSPTTQAVWKRYSRNNEIRYEINLEHPTIAALISNLDPETAPLARAALRQIEQNFPVSAFADDSLTRSDDISQSVMTPAEIERQLGVIAPKLLAQANGDVSKTRKMLECTEPFQAHWDFVEHKLDEWDFKA
ncbi:MAG: ATP-binding protein [Maricaulis sp.]|uniref:ATP-binding protein n=1 Tax=Maricaulis sp. TaxID=1486257 RepID=UPI001B20BA9D|nr:ATP-binding protein [Maricaulis sp.]MBO6696998.1 ATP-binding protein [Henriciella sp.]MBO6878297.1 ATP-binding protein [Maricaulis sp.]